MVLRPARAAGRSALRPRAVAREGNEIHTFDELSWNDAAPGIKPGQFLPADSLRDCCADVDPGSAQADEDTLAQYNNDKQSQSGNGQLRALGLRAVPSARDGGCPRRRDAGREQARRWLIFTAISSSWRRRAARWTSAQQAASAGVRRRRSEAAAALDLAIGSRRVDDTAESSRIADRSAKAAATEAAAGLQAARAKLQAGACFGLGASGANSQNSPIRAGTVDTAQQTRAVLAVSGPHRNALSHDHAIKHRRELRCRRAKHQLWVRIYPDDCSIDTFEPISRRLELANIKNVLDEHLSRRRR